VPVAPVVATTLGGHVPLVGPIPLVRPPHSLDDSKGAQAWLLHKNTMQAHLQLPRLSFPLKVNTKQILRSDQLY